MRYIRRKLLLEDEGKEFTIKQNINNSVGLVYGDEIYQKEIVVGR